MWPANFIEDNLSKEANRPSVFPQILLNQKFLFVCTTNIHGAGWFWVRIPLRQKTCSFPHLPKPTVELIQPPKKRVPELFPVVKRPGRDVKNPTPPSAKVKKESGWASTPPLGQVCMLWGDHYLHIEKFSALVHKKRIPGEMNWTQSLKTVFYKIHVNIIFPFTPKSSV